eukprot:gene5876-4196_t
MSRHTDASGAEGEGAPAPEARLEDCTLHLVHKLLPVLGGGSDSSAAPSSYTELAWGCSMYRILHGIAPNIFAAVQSLRERDPQMTAGQAVTAMKGNVVTLIRHMNEYARNVLDAKRNDFNLTALVNASCIVQHALDSEAQDHGGPADEGSQAEEGRQQLHVLTNLFVAMIALSGLPNALNALKQLPREEQLVLSKATREAMAAYGLRGALASADPRHSSRLRAGFASPGSGGSTRGALEDSGEYYRAKTVQLTRELEEVRARAHEMESRYVLDAEEKRNLEAKYQQLLLEVKERPSVDISSLQATLKIRDDTIKALNAKVDEQQSRLTSLKHAVTAHDLQTEVTKQKVKQLEETIVRMLEDRRELESKLSLAEDKVASQGKARDELQNEVEDLRSQLRMAQLTQKNGGGGGDGEPSFSLANASFASTGSIDRALVLEKEVTEMRRQRDNLQKQVHVLQRQFAASSMPRAGAGVHSAAQDTLKAQVRQLEREREQLKRQLQQAQDRLVELESTRGALHKAETGEEARTPQRATTPAAVTPHAEGAAEEGEAALDGTVATAPATAKQQQTLLTSLLLSYAYQNLALQQHDILLFKDSIEARGERRRARDPAAVAAGETHRGSALLRQRRLIEEGLLESVVHHHIGKWR